jgi:hypothetical protein
LLWDWPTLDTCDDDDDKELHYLIKRYNIEKYIDTIKDILNRLTLSYLITLFITYIIIIIIITTIIIITFIIFIILILFNHC